MAPPARNRRRPPLLLLACLLAGGREYQPAIRCSGTWTDGGSLLEGGRVVVGRVEGAGHGDVGRTIGVRIHGADHATKPSLGTPLVLWGLGAPIVALSLWGLLAWWRLP